VSERNVDVIDLGGLSSQDWETWRHHHAARRPSAGMSESPDFLVPLAQEIGKCRVVRIREGGKIVGYIPVYQPFGPSFAFPIPMCDYQAVALFDASYPDYRRILQQAGICRWKYENITDGNGLSEVSRRFDGRPVPMVLMAESFPEYLRDKANNGSTFHSILPMSRRLAREVGGVSLIRATSSEEFVDLLLEHKIRRQPGTPPFDPFVRKVLLRFAGRESGEIRGVPYILMAGDEALALALTLEAGDHAFYWFCSYEPDFARYSPGSVLLIKIIEELHARKFRTLDLGPGGEPWKERFATKHRTACNGHIYSYEALGDFEAKVRGVVRSIRSTMKS